MEGKYLSSFSFSLFSAIHRWNHKAITVFCLRNKTRLWYLLFVFCSGVVDGIWNTLQCRVFSRSFEFQSKPVWRACPTLCFPSFRGWAKSLCRLPTGQVDHPHLCPFCCHTLWLVFAPSWWDYHHGPPSIPLSWNAHQNFA